MKGNDSNDRGKTKNSKNYTDKSCNLKNTKRQTQGPTGLCELFLLTVPTEEVARCQYKTLLIIFPLNLKTITKALDVVKWRGGVSKTKECERQSIITDFMLGRWRMTTSSACTASAGTT